MSTKTKNIVLTCVLAIFFFGLSIFAWLKPADDYSYTERKPLKHHLRNREELLAECLADYGWQMILMKHQTALRSICDVFTGYPYFSLVHL